MLAVRYTGLIPHLIKAVQEQQQEIDELKNENNSLKIELQNEINELRKLINK